MKNSKETEKWFVRYLICKSRITPITSKEEAMKIGDKLKGEGYKNVTLVKLKQEKN